MVIINLTIDTTREITFKQRNIKVESGPTMIGALPIQYALKPIHRSNLVFSDDGYPGDKKFENFQKKVTNKGKKISGASNKGTFIMG